MATLKDIAEMAGISVSTASLALRDHESISLKTKRRVWGAQEKLGYKGSRGAKRSGKKARETPSRTTMDIAFVLCERRFDDRLYAQAFDAIAEAAQPHGIRPVYIPISLENLQAGEFPALLKSPDIEGVIVTGIYDLEAHSALKRLKVPIVIYGSYYLGREPWASCEPDLAFGVRLMFEKLMELGHRRLTLVTSNPLLHYGFEVKRAFEYLASYHQIKTSVFNHEEASWAADLKTHLQSPDASTGIILSSDGIFGKVMEVCRECALSVPEDISIMAFESGYDVGDPRPVSIVRSNIKDFGKLTINKLMRLIQNRDELLTREIISMSMVEGSTVAASKQSQINANPVS